MTKEKMDRISFLTRLARERDLTASEQVERQALREEYIAGYRQNLVDQLENTTLVEPDGKKTPLRKKKVKTDE